LSLVVDASVAAKWVVPEPDSDRADALKTEPGGLLAPTLVLAEVGNVLWKRTRRGDLTTPDAFAAMTIVASLLPRLVPLEELAPRALEIAVQLDHPIYDCFYLALAERERIPLVSADRRLPAAAAKLTTVQFRPL
jgi:predicted nucleic acid-binding protein